MHMCGSTLEMKRVTTFRGFAEHSHSRKDLLNERKELGNVSWGLAQSSAMWYSSHFVNSV